MTDQREVYVILWRENNGECLRSHGEVYQSETEAMKALAEAKHWASGKATYVHGFIEAEQAGEWF